jgi:hypothetical protein
MNYYKNHSLENIVAEIDGVIEIEEWKDIPGYECYQVSTFGRVKSSKVGKVKILKQAFHRRGYLVVALRKEGMSKSIKVHRLVGFTFLKRSIVSMNEINHINLDKRDNFYKNIEWSNRSLNMKHCIKHGAQRRDNEYNGRARILMHKEYGVFCTLRQAAKMEGVSDPNLWMQLKEYKSNGRNTKRRNRSKFIYV